MDPAAARLLFHEARALLARLERVEPFALQETMVPAACVPAAALAGMERSARAARAAVREAVRAFLAWLDGAGRGAAAAEGQRRFCLLRLRFNAALARVDTFADVLSQRSEHGVGVWLAGLDAAAADLLALPDAYTPPPVVCYLDRGLGAAIRRARTRLPGGGPSPVAILRVPRERMVGSGIAASIAHEVGHQAAALLELVPSLRPTLRGLGRGPGGGAWVYWERWLSEILADLWAVAQVGVAGTMGLMAVVSLPRPFVFRVSLDDPHPFPWIRVALSCAMGDALYPHPQWTRLRRLWEALYPLDGLDAGRRAVLAALVAGMPGLVALLAHHRPRPLGGRTLAEGLSLADRVPARLTALHQAWRRAPALARRARPALALAVVGQARADGRLGPEAEGAWVAALLRAWALRRTLSPAPRRARPGATRRRALAA